jgi:NAD(P)-dependent dehydrogenase (short-subunit alcohol dehydrogenase family)
MRLANKIALITGGSRGIGRGIAIGFAREGADIIVNYRTRRDRAEEVGNVIKGLGRKVALIQADMGKPEVIPEFIEKAWDTFGRIDILVNNAGIAYFQDFLEMSFEQWREVLSVNLDGVMLCSQIVAKKMIKAGVRGKIINVSSINGFQVEKRHAHYNVSKAGLDMLTKSMAVELGPYGINVNSIAPDIVYTEIIPEGFWEKEGAEFIKKTPLGRKADVEDCVGPAIFLASDEARYIQGHILVLDGGMSINQL